MPLPAGFFRRHAVGLYHHSLRQVHQLRFLFFELTQRCNLACLHCGSDCQRTGSPPELTHDQIIGVLEDVREAWKPEDILVTLTGGEPLVWPGVFELGSAIRDMGFRWSMVTNGHAWGERDFALAKAAGLANIAVSVDGAEPDHDWLRQREGAWHKTMAMVQRLVTDKVSPRMDVVTCVNPRNLPRLDLLRDELIRIGVRRWRVFTICPIGRAPEHPELFLSPTEFHELMNRVLVWRESKDITVNLANSGYLGQKLERRVRDHDYFCLAGVHIGGVMANGDFLACPNIDRGLAQGNVATDSFVDAWNNRYQQFRSRKWMKVDGCESCKEWPACQGNDIHLWDVQQGKSKLCHFRHFELDGFTPPSR